MTADTNLPAGIHKAKAIIEAITTVLLLVACILMLRYLYVSQKQNKEMHEAQLKALANIKSDTHDN